MNLSGIFFILYGLIALGALGLSVLIVVVALGKKRG